MKVSINAVKQFTDVDISVDELTAKVNSQLGTIEQVTNLGEMYQDALIVKIVSARKHPDADRLNVCMVDDAGVREDVERNDDGLVQVVCGAPNVKAGMFAVWLPPRSVVPATYHDETPFVLGARELRGIMSQGMLAAGDELAINGDHDGIVELTANDLPAEAELTVGAKFAETFGLDDQVIDIENKMFTHRPDLFGQLGVAREIAGIQHARFVSPEWYLNTPEFARSNDLQLEVFNDAHENVPRFMSVAMRDVTIQPSPFWLQCALVRMGGKPINNVVDITNYVMLMTAQPVHAYDYDKIRGHKLGARMAQPGETLKLLNDKTYTLNESDIVIADADGAVGLAGIMGGGESEVDASTNRIVLEVATFDMYTLRKSSMKYGLFTDALARFNKGQSPLQNDVVAKLLMTMMTSVAGAVQASDVRGTEHDDERRSIRITASFVNDRLGLKLSSGDIVKLLSNVELDVRSPDDHDTYLEVFPPFWRTDLELPEDVVEEVGRLYGYDHLPRELPKRTISPTIKNQDRELNKLVRDALAGAGASEVLTYSFVHENVLKRANQDPAQAYRLSNALSPDLQYYRLSLTPSLLDKVHMNIKAGHDEFALFEIGKAHSKLARLDELEHLPPQLRRIALVYAAKKPKAGAAYFQAQALLRSLLDALGISAVYKPIGEASGLAVTKPFDGTRSARVVDQATGQTIGVIGEYDETTAAQFKLPTHAAGFELMPEAIQFARADRYARYVPLGKFPSTHRDVSLRVPRELAYQTVVDALRLTYDSVAITATLKTIYHAEASDQQTMTFGLTLTPSTRTLSADEASSLVEAVTAPVVSDLNAELV